MVTITPNLQLQVPTVGADSGPLYGQEISASLASMDNILGGANNLSVAGNANVTLMLPQSQNLIQNFSGVLTGNVVVVFPAQGHLYCVQNNTTGNFLLGIAVSGSPNVLTIPQGLSVFAWSDGATFRISNPPGWSEISSLAISGASTVLIPLLAPFRRFRITGQGMQATSATNQLQALLSINGGSSFAGTFTTVQETASPGGVAVVAGSGISIGPVSAGVSTTTAFDFVTEIWPGAGSLGATVKSEMTFFSNTLGAQAACRTSTSSNVIGANALQLAVIAGTLSGTVILEGLP